MLVTPLLTIELHRDRWDYVYYLNPRRGQVQNRRLTLFFKDSRLDHFENDPMPNEDEVDTLILGPNIKRVARVNRQPEIPMPDVSTPAPGSSSN
jgi:outer membrane protein assembly factor BamE